jgi:hypothetical protein
MRRSAPGYLAVGAFRGEWLAGTVTDLAADRAHRLIPLTEADAEEVLDDFRAGERLFDSRRGGGAEPRRGARCDRPRRSARGAPS